MLVLGRSGLEAALEGDATYKVLNVLETALSDVQKGRFCKEGCG